MSTELEGYVALITGGSSGIGYEMAKQLLSEGAEVIIAARRRGRLEAARERLEWEGLHPQVLPMDVTDEESVDRAVKWFRDRYDRLDMLVNDAGIGNNAPGMEGIPRDHTFLDVPVKTVRAVVDTNVIGSFIVAKKFVPFLLKSERASLVYVSTSAGTMTRAGQLPYGPSKAAGEAMAWIMAQELQDTGIDVNIVCPGGFTDTAMAGEGDLEYMRENGLPVLEPTVLNRTISFLASPASAGITGEKIIGKDFDAWLAEREIDF
ncbi:MAG: SDR family oxidoreductase [Lachnospiraceae bacterium]|nr:SDR family oxidoreductase [Lachnospiraceae bacterium]MBQ1516408.1 SDR family oxidoreductase [Lachnospiraceae bacterium]